MRRKILTLVLSVAVIASLVIVGCAPEVAPPPEEEEAPPEEEEAPPAVPEEEVFEWKMQSTFGLGSWDYLCGKRVVDRIVEMSEGRLKIEYLAPGTIVAAFEQLEAVDKGVLDAGQSWSGYWVGKDSAFTLFASCAGGPFGMDTFDHMGWMFFGGGYDLFRELYAEIGYKNVVPFIVKGEFPEPLGWFPKPLTRYEDLAGYKMRVAGLAAEVFKEAGVSVVTVSGAEILPLLEKGVIDASEYSDPHSDMLLGIADVLKYYHAPGVHQPTGYVEILINRQKWEELPPDLQNIVELACHELLLKNTVEEYILGQEALETLKKDYGVTVVESPDEILVKLLAAWDTVAARECAKNPHFAKIYESQEEYASKIVPYRRLFFKDYSFTADYYWK